MNILSVDGVKKHFRGDMSLAKREVLRGVSFHAREGEILGFLGPNGAGKTTTIKVVLGLIRPNAGSVRIFDFAPGDARAMARVGYLPETPYFYPHLSLSEFLEFCGRVSGAGGADLAERIDRTVELVDLTPHRGKRLKAFSKGMLQRAGLAQAILHDPDLYILDEPFSGLDPVGRKLVRDILVDLKKRGKTIVFSSHILGDLETLCDRAVIIRDGLIVRSVELDDLMKMGEGSVEVTVRGWRAHLMQGIKEHVESSRTTGEDAFLVVREQRFVRPVIERLYEGGAEVLAVVNRHRTLENLFLREIARPEAGAAKEQRKEKRVFTGF
jgi:ABC-2 type transport system ATP-binding protein